MDAAATTAVALASTGDNPRPSPQDTANVVQVPWNGCGGCGMCLYGLCTTSCPSGDSKASGRVHITGLPLLDWTLSASLLPQFDAQGSSNLLWAPAEAAHEHRPFTDAASSASTASLPLLATSPGLSSTFMLQKRTADIQGKAS